jgi:hypothetical protein
VTRVTAEGVGATGSATGHMSVVELARRQGVRPIRSAAELICPDVFESDAEVDEFIEFVHTLRQADVA